MVISGEPIVEFNRGEATDTGISSPISAIESFEMKEKCAVVPFGAAFGNELRKFVTNIFRQWQCQRQRLSHGDNGVEVLQLISA